MLLPCSLFNVMQSLLLSLSLYLIANLHMGPFSISNEVNMELQHLFPMCFQCSMHYDVLY